MAEFEREYELEFFGERGFRRYVCKKCGSAFWSAAERATCGDTPCNEYSFIGNPIIGKKKRSIEDMRETFLNFFEKRGHERINRYPVIARWRTDVLLVNASIYDFQPHVTSGIAEPPANPLVISQPCIRMNDLDSVGLTGKHISCFEMMAHHAFNYPEAEVYWKEETVRYCHELLTRDLGIAEEDITYKEHTWVGGGNAGPSLEVIVGGLELATLVFMNLVKEDNGNVVIDGERYSPMDIRVVDTGYGLERFVWASLGTPTIYDAIFDYIISEIIENARLPFNFYDEKIRGLISDYAKVAGLMDVRGHSFHDLIDDIARRLEKMGHKVDKYEFLSIITSLQKVYAIADHTKSLALLLSDGAVPSNIKAGYLARLIIRRTLRMMEDLKIDIKIADLVLHHMDRFSYMLDMEMRNVVKDMLEIEEDRYARVVEKGKGVISSLLGRKKSLSTEDLIVLYDSHGLHPSVVKKIAEGFGVSVDIPRDFHAIIAERHKPKVKEVRATKKYDYPPTKLLYYDDQKLTKCRAKVVGVQDGWIFLDQTVFYPEGGGQPCDHGYLMANNKKFKVLDVQKFGDVVGHKVDSNGIRVGDEVECQIDWERRAAHMRHHSATHVIMGACRRVLGNHVWQAGSQLSDREARLDISHYKPISSDEIKKIEYIANNAVLSCLPINAEFVDRKIAEQKYGFRLYQGGVPEGKKIRVVEVQGFDVEACGGTHCTNTGEIGMIKIVRCERIQDGVERLIFTAGIASLNYVQEINDTLEEVASIVRVPRKDVIKGVEKIVNEWKKLKKFAEKGQIKDFGNTVNEMISKAKSVNDTRIISGFIEGGIKELTNAAKIIRESVKKGYVVVIGAIADARGYILLARSKDVDVNCNAVMAEVAKKYGVKGGGKADFAQGMVETDRIKEIVWECVNIIEKAIKMR